MDSHVKVFAIVVSFNGAKWIRKCMDSLFAEKALPLEVVDVDNGSTDETLQILEMEFPEVHIIRNDQNRGFGKANNQGIEYAFRAGASHFLLLNQDAWVREGTVARLVEVQQKWALPLVSPLHMNGTGLSFDRGFYKNLMRAGSGSACLGDFSRGTMKDYYACPFINAACWLIPRETVLTVGGFDPIFFHYGEDGDYCDRVIFHIGYPCVVSGAEIRHDRDVKGNETLWEQRKLLIRLFRLYGLRSTSRKERRSCHLRNLRFFMHNLLAMNFKDARHIANSYLAFLRSFPEIKEHARKNRIKGPNWLILD